MFTTIRPQLFFPAVLALCVATAFGCASTDESVSAHPASYPKAPIGLPKAGGSGARVDASPLNHATAPKQASAAHAHGPVSLTGEVPYAERFDPSGWSGSSTPPNGIGGGPASGENAENPYEENASPTPGADNGGGTAQGLAPSSDAITPTTAPSSTKELDTTPRADETPQKDLQTNPSTDDDEKPPAQ